MAEEESYTPPGIHQEPAQRLPDNPPEGDATPPMTLEQAQSYISAIAALPDVAFPFDFGDGDVDDAEAGSISTPADYLATYGRLPEALDISARHIAAAELVSHNTDEDTQQVREVLVRDGEIEIRRYGEPGFRGGRTTLSLSYPDTPLIPTETYPEERVPPREYLNMARERQGARASIDWSALAEYVRTNPSTSISVSYDPPDNKADRYTFTAQRVGDAPFGEDLDHVNIATSTGLPSLPIIDSRRTRPLNATTARDLTPVELYDMATASQRAATSVATW